MDRNINLPANHLRTLSASMYMIEKSINEMENILQARSNGFTYEIDFDVTEDDISNTMDFYKQIRDMIGKFVKKYRLDKDVTHMSRLIQAKNSRIWQILCDTNSNRLKGYGVLPEKIADELDDDVSSILQLIEELIGNDPK